MQEFMLYIRNASKAKDEMLVHEKTEFVKRCETYIEALKDAGALLSAQPMQTGGKILCKLPHGWQTHELDIDKESIVGYYHIRAMNLDAALEWAKQNPEFAFVPGATIEIRNVKTVEDLTGYEYPK